MAGRPERTLRDGNLGRHGGSHLLLRNNLVDHDDVRSTLVVGAAAARRRVAVQDVPKIAVDSDIESLRTREAGIRAPWDPTGGGGVKSVLTINGRSPQLVRRPKVAML